jgi:uncharacterized membrane protein YfcA
VELVAFAIWCFLVALAGGLVGLVLGNIRLPATLLVAPSAASGGGANLLISGASAFAAAVTHVRAGRINWRLFWWMAPPSVAGALAGGYLAGVIDENVLLACIAAVLFYSGFDLLRWRPRSAAAVAGAGAETAPAGFDRVAAVVSGAVIGLLGGLVGLILGSLRMPALLRRVGEPAHTAVGTNLAVGVCVGVAGALGHLPSGAPDWTAAGVGAAASIPGALLGARLTGRLSETQLVRAIAAILLVAATSMVVQIVV